jgi:hypothetical protein
VHNPKIPVAAEKILRKIVKKCFLKRFWHNSYLLGCDTLLQLFKESSVLILFAVYMYVTYIELTAQCDIATS